MKKSELRSGDIVKTREGQKYIVLLNIIEYGDLLINLSDGYFLNLKGYEEDLTFGNRNQKHWDIVAVCALDFPGDNLRQHGLTKWAAGYKWTWERKEVKKMTVSEICKELGYEIEIIKEN